MDKINFFSTDYRDGRVYIGNKSYSTGTFITHLLNGFYGNDTADKTYRLALNKMEAELTKQDINKA